MLIKTHLALGVFAILLLFNKVEYQFAFVIVTLIATILPDIDSGFSTSGKHVIFRPIQWLTKHRGMIHSYTICLIITALLVFSSVPVFALPFFLGYGLHLFADSFTLEGIRPFWPFRFESRGVVRVGGSVEHTLFIIFCIADAVLLVLQFFS